MLTRNEVLNLQIGDELEYDFPNDTTFWDGEITEVLWVAENTTGEACARVSVFRFGGDLTGTVTEGEALNLI